MRVLHLDSGHHMRGGQWQALYLMVGQKTIGSHPFLLAPESSALAKEAASRGVPVSSLSLLSVARQSRLVDITHAHDAHSHTLAAIAAKSPLIVSRRVAFPVHTGFLNRWKYRRPARYLAISAYVARQLIAAGVHEDRIGIVFDGVPIEPRTPGMGDRILAPKWDDPRKLTQLTIEAGRLAGVEIHFSDRLKHDLPSARALVYLSDMEGLGSAALLALAMGVPVIASNVGGLPEIVHHEATGILVQNNAQNVAAAITRLMKDASLAEKLGYQGRELVKRGFTLADMALRTSHEYKKVIG